MGYGTNIYTRFFRLGIKKRAVTSTVIDSFRDNTTTKIMDNQFYIYNMYCRFYSITNFSMKKSSV